MRTATIIGLLILLGCGGQSGSLNKDFVELRDKLPKIKTPITFDSNGNLDLISVELTDNELLKS